MQMVRLLALSVGFSLATLCAAHADDSKVVQETPKAGEKSRAVTYNKDGKVEMVDVYFTSGLWQRQLFDRYTGLKTFERKEILKGWQMVTSWQPNGAIRDQKLLNVVGDEQKKLFDTTVQKDGGRLISRFANNKVDCIDLVAADGKLTRVHLNYEGVPSGILTKGNWQEQKDGSQITTLFDDDGKDKHSEQLFADGKRKVVYYKDGVISATSLYPTPDTQKYSGWINEENYKNGRLFCFREATLDSGLVIKTYGYDGKTETYRQTWVKGASKSYADRFALNKLVEFNADGTLKRTLSFDQNGVNVTEVSYFAQGKLIRKVYLRPDGYNRVNGTVEKVDTYVNGKMVKTELFAAAAKKTEDISRDLLKDPVYGEDQPGVVRIQSR
jgi:hypothetical protein